MVIDVRVLARSTEELLANVSRREPFVNPDGRSSAAFERVWIDGSPHVVKYVHPDQDFALRVSGDLSCRMVRAWAAGLLTPRPTSSTTPSSVRRSDTGGTGAEQPF